jgi:hypothetical protein
MDDSNGADENDVRLIAFVLQGAMLQAAEMITSAHRRAFTQPIYVEQPVNGEGQAKHFFRVRLASGAVLRVTVDDERLYQPDS